MSLGRRAFLKRAGVGAAVLAGGSGILKSSAFAMNPSKFQAKSDVSFVGSSSSGTRRKMITDVLAPWKDKVAAGIEGKTILIKPNMVYWYAMISDPKLGLTHVDAVRGLIDFLRSISATAPIIIGDIPAVNPNLMTILTNAGYDALVSEYSGVTLMDIGDTTKVPAVDRHIWTPSFSNSSPATIAVSSAFTDPKYYVISIARPKTHNCMTMTGVNKNILMAAPILSAVVNGKTVNTKNYMHGQDGWSSGQNKDENKCLAYNLYQLANVIYPTGAPALAVLDAWEGMEGDGPVSGTSIMQYCAVAGIDPLAVDRLSAKLMGFSDTATDPMNSATPSYTDMRALVWISNAGFGNYDLNKINFILGSLTSLNTYVKQYKLHSNYTGNPSYETNWTGSAPATVFDAAAVKDSHFLDPKPYLVPQIHDAITAGEVKIDFTLPVSFMADLGIYTMRGVEVRRLGSEFLQCGRYTKVWDRRDNTGSRVPAGNYIIKLGFGSGSLCDKISIVN
jgi:uncharacterized protein (DUF362 family)